MAKKKMWLGMPVLAFVLVLAGCAGGTPLPPDPTPKFVGEDLYVATAQTGIIGTNWYLLRVQNPNQNVDVDRAELAKDGMGDVFSLRFDGENRVSGKGAPNSYTADCGWGDDSTVAIGAIAATRMIAFKEPPMLKEAEFFALLSRVVRCNLTPSGLLELHTAPDAAGGSATLTFARMFM